MKLALSWLILFFLIIFQITLGQSFGLIGVALPLCLIAMVVFSVFLPTEQLLYMALTAGVVLDANSGRDFGLNITFLLFVALFCKLVLRLDERSQTLPMVLLLSSLMVIMYNFLLFVVVFSVDHLSEISSYMSQLGIQVGYTIICATLLFVLVSWVNRVQWKFGKKRKFVVR